MTADMRRKEISDILKRRQSPLSAADLAKKLGVTRQTVVGDIALLRAQGLEILATPTGYMLASCMAKGSMLERTLACCHQPEQLENELFTIVDNGGEILDVIVEHPVYGQITGRLDIKSRFDAGRFIDNIYKQNAPLLSQLTDGIHLHTIRCKDDDTYQRIYAALFQKGLLLSRE